GALLILAVGSLLVVGIERNTSRAFSDRERANLAARAGLEDVKGIFAKEAANDDFLILHGPETKGPNATKDPAPYLYLARGTGGGENVSFRYIPLFSARGTPPGPTAGDPLKAPLAETLLDPDTRGNTDIAALPWHDSAKVSWMNILNPEGKVVSRYAYWVEDLQSRVDASTAGNTKDDGGTHKRYGWKTGDTSQTAAFPAPGLNADVSNPGSDGRDTAPPLDQVALFALDPVSGAKDETTVDKTIIEGRKALLSPDSVLAVAGVVPPLTRGADGSLADAKANSLEKNLIASVQPYDEQPLVPYAFGINASVTGKPKLNLNALLAQSPDAAVDEMAAWIKKGLPSFEEERKGGFPEDYLKTLAASAIGYASDGNKPVVQLGVYRGLGASPMISEIVMNIHYLGFFTRGGNKFMRYEFVLFAELFNHTNLPVGGNAALSYEVGLPLPGIGASPAGTRFDDPSVVSSSAKGTPQAPLEISLQGDRYWTIDRPVSLEPGEYKFIRFATVNYEINIGPGSVGANFTLTEPLGAAGLSMKWNGTEVERIPSVVRAPFGLTFNASFKKYFGKASIPGHSYGPFGEFINNMGDPRIAHFIRFQGEPVGSANGVPLGENSFPGNISPNRRNIRFGSIYSLSGDANKLTTYGRVIPSEWPDGGHDAAVSTWSSGWSTARQGSTEPVLLSGTGPGFDPTTIPGGPLPEAGEAITYLSNRKRYFSATELGRIYDPIMFLPTFDPSSGLNSARLRADGEPSNSAGFMPAAGAPWPLVQIGNSPSPYFGGGNTLRIGRPEHPRFDQPVGHVPANMPPEHAARLLDLFHAGKSRSSSNSLREGPVVRIEGHVNINTASRDSLRAMAAGFLQMDPKLSRRTSDAFDSRMAPPVEPLDTVSALTQSKEADTVADAIIRGRPYTSPSELACAMNSDGKEVFGNEFLYPYTTSGQSYSSQLQWSDAAAEEIFGRVYEASTVRSRNFRVWVIGQAVSPTAVGNQYPEILSETRKAFTVFADPGERRDGVIELSKTRVKILHENDF
ncbi:MAG: hypothetical protein ACRCXD_15365, partial [Luteolibacter sp.]